METKLTGLQMQILQYMADGGHLNYSDGRFNWKPPALPPYIDAREIEQLEDAGLLSFRPAFSSSIGSITTAGRLALKRTGE